MEAVELTTVRFKPEVKSRVGKDQPSGPRSLGILTVHVSKDAGLWSVWASVS